LLDRCDRIDQIISRIGRLEAAQSELGLALSSSSEREMLARLAKNITRHAGFVEQAHRELLVIGRSGYGDALIECAPLAHARPMRDLLFETYVAWAEQRNYRMLLIREPMSDDEPLMMAIFGAYAYGYLRGEAGHHRLRIEQDTYTAKVGVAEIIASTASGVPLSVQKALKQMGQLGHRVRSRVELRNSAFVVQNAGSLAESRELAEAYGPSWIGAAQNPDTIVRRYDQMPFLLKDHLTGTHTGRAEILQPQPFHELLCQRIDVVSSAK